MRTKWGTKRELGPARKNTDLSGRRSWSDSDNKRNGRPSFESMYILLVLVQWWSCPRCFGHDRPLVQVGTRNNHTSSGQESQVYSGVGLLPTSFSIACTCRHISNIEEAMKYDTKVQSTMKENPMGQLHCTFCFFFDLIDVCPRLLSHLLCAVVVVQCTTVSVYVCGKSDC